ncbi:MAG: hypothetical protein KKA81_07430 [Bacteroidetes bacterium]|nr:hypothetical protein [Bacteroidota bacterium]
MKTLLSPKQIIISLVLTLGIFSTVSLFAQDPSQALTAEYSRPSLTFFIATCPGDNLSSNAAQSAEKIDFSDKYFNHNLSSLKAEMPADFKSKSIEEKKLILQDYFKKKGIGREMVAKWFKRGSDGMFDLDYVFQCGMYNATDQDVLMSEASKRGEALLKDAGQNLINKTYLLVMCPKTFASFDDENKHGWNASYDFFLYKLEFDNEEVMRFYEIWPYDDDPEEVKKSKIASFDTTNFNFYYVYSKMDQSATAMELKMLTSHPKSSAQLFDDVVEKMYNNAMFSVDKDLEEFRVKADVSGTHPIRAKIGKKEGLKTDQRYFVYEFVWDDKTGTAGENRKAVVRATGKITDNRNVATGKSGESKFYQVYGGTVRQGMLMQQRNDFGISLVGGYEIGDIGGGTAGLWIRTGFFTRVPSLYVMIDGGFDTGEYNLLQIEDKSIDTTKMDDYSFLRYSVGLGKGIRFARIFELIPYAAWGQESTSNKEYSAIRTNYIKAGGLLGISVTHFLSFIGKVNYTAPFGDVTTKRDVSGSESVTRDFTWTDKFHDREGLSFMAGIRIEF